MNVRAKIILLSGFFATCAAGSIWTAWLQERADANIKPADLYAIVDRQLGELRAGNFHGAYEYASRDIQRRFDLAQFTAMVEWEYPGMAHSSRAEYGPVETDGHRARMQVYLIGRYGEIIPCEYMMIKEGDAWRIDGARVSQPWPSDLRMDGALL